MLKKCGLIVFALVVGFVSINRAAADYSIDSSFGIGLWGAPEATGSFGPDYAGGAPPVAASREYSIGGFVGVIRGTGSLAASDGNFGVTATIESNAYNRTGESSGSLTVRNSFTLAWNGNGTPTPLPDTPLKAIFGLTGSFEVGPLTSLPLVQPSAETLLRISSGGRSYDFRKTLPSFGYDYPIPPTLAFPVHQSSVGDYPFEVQLKWHATSTLARAAVRFDDGVTLQRIEFQDGTTPESIGYSVQFESGMESPNVREFAPRVGDFNRDGVVDGQDFLTWQRHAGLEFHAHPSQGDANNDGDIDLADLSVWSSSFGGAGLSPSSEPLPEPQTATLLVTGLLASLARRSRSD